MKGVIPVVIAYSTTITLFYFFVVIPQHAKRNSKRNAKPDDSKPRINILRNSKRNTKPDDLKSGIDDITYGCNCNGITFETTLI